MNVFKPLNFCCQFCGDLKQYQAKEKCAGCKDNENGWLVGWLVDVPVTCQAYLRDGPAWIIVCADTR